MNILIKKKNSYEKLEQIQSYLLRSLEIRLQKLRKRENDIQESINQLLSTMNDEFSMHSKHSVNLPDIKAFVDLQQKKMMEKVIEKSNILKLEKSLLQVIQQTKREKEKYEKLKDAQQQKIIEQMLKQEQDIIDDMNQKKPQGSSILY